jgi:hypothetical protein
MLLFKNKIHTEASDFHAGSSLFNRIQINFWLYETPWKGFLEKANCLSIVMDY